MMVDLNNKSILFFSPQFFGYHIEIKNKLQEFGAKVIWYDDRPSNSFTTKFFLRINKKLLNKTCENYYESIKNELYGKKLNFDYILFISPESISKESLKDLKTTFNSSRFILYMWDSFKNKQALDLLSEFHAIFSFDPNDCKKYKIKFRPLFFLDIYATNHGLKSIYDLLFVGTAHSDRYLFVKKIIKQLDSKLIIKLFFYLNGKPLFLLKKIFDQNFRNVKYTDISFKSLSLQENCDLVKSSNIILDINHPKQIGLTMRTIETLGAQKKLITTNKDIRNYDFYNENNILIIDRENPVIPLQFIKSVYKVNTDFIINKYSLSGWMYEIFDNNI